METELGLLRNDGTPKPVLLEMGRFRGFLDSLPFQTLPQRQIDGVCLLIQNQDDWATAYRAFLLAKQADLEIEIAGVELQTRATPKRQPTRFWVAIAEFRFGTLTTCFSRRAVPRFWAHAAITARRFSGATRLARARSSSTPRRSKPRSRPDSTRPGAFAADAPAFWRVYHEIAKIAPLARWASFESPSFAVTQRQISSNQRLIVAINHTDEVQYLSVKLQSEVRLAQVLRGEVIGDAPHALTVTIPAFDAVVFALQSEPTS